MAILEKNGRISYSLNGRGWTRAESRIQGRANTRSLVMEHELLILTSPLESRNTPRSRGSGKASWLQGLFLHH